MRAHANAFRYAQQAACGGGQEVDQSTTETLIAEMTGPDGAMETSNKPADPDVRARAG